MSKYSNKIVITTGDVNGIGAEITIKALNMLRLPPKDVLIISNKKILNSAGNLDNNYEVLELDYDGKVEYGKITPQSGDFSFRLLEKACELKPQYIVTAPTSKEAMHMAGHNFNGQTEVLEHFLAHDGQKAEMLFVSKDFRVLLLTRHVSLSDVPKLITKDLIIDKITRLADYFKENLYKTKPQFAFCGLNPHSGENGIIGTEEIDVIIPALNELRSKDFNITNPLSADMVFSKAVNSYLKGEKQPYDCYISCYHDQGLIPIKCAGINRAVNMTIGLDIVRTSPCHGTAFDIAGKNIANPESMIEAIKQCLY